MFDDDSLSEEEILENLYEFLDHPDLKEDFKDSLRDEIAERFLEIIIDYKTSYIRVPNSFVDLVLKDLIQAKFIDISRMYDFSFVQITKAGEEFLNKS